MPESLHVSNICRSLSSNSYIYWVLQQPQNPF